MERRDETIFDQVNVGAFLDNQTTRGVVFVGNRKMQDGFTIQVPIVDDLIQRPGSPIPPSSLSFDVDDYFTNDLSSNRILHFESLIALFATFK